MITLQEWYNFNCKDNDIFVEHQSVYIKMYRDRNTVGTVFEAKMSLSDAVEIFGSYGVVRIRLVDSADFNPVILAVSLCMEVSNDKDV